MTTPDTSPLGEFIVEAERLAGAYKGENDVTSSHATFLNFAALARAIQQELARVNERLTVLEHMNPCDNPDCVGRLDSNPKTPYKPNEAKLKRLAKNIRKDLEEGSMQKRFEISVSANAVQVEPCGCQYKIVNGKVVDQRLCKQGREGGHE